MQTSWGEAREWRSRPLTSCTSIQSALVGNLVPNCHLHCRPHYHFQRHCLCPSVSSLLILQAIQFILFIPHPIYVNLAEITSFDCSARHLVPIWPGEPETVRIEGYWSLKQNAIPSFWGDVGLMIKVVSEILRKVSELSFVLSICHFWRGFQPILKFGHFWVIFPLTGISQQKSFAIYHLLGEPLKGISRNIGILSQPTWPFLAFFSNSKTFSLIPI